MDSLNAFIAAVIGGVITIAGEWWFRHIQERKDAEFLVILVTRHLDLYILGCIEIVGDDGQPDIDGNYYSQTSEPKFEPELLEVEWKSLPVKLLYDVFDLPTRAEQTSKKLSDLSQISNPPDFEEWFEERQYQYAGLGYDAYILTNNLRAHAGLPKKNWYTEHRDLINYMQEKRSKIENLRIIRHSGSI